MANENVTWIMKGLAWNDPYRIRTWQELVNWVNEVGFLPESKQQAGLSNRYISDMLIVMKSMFKYAVRTYHIYNPMEYIKMPRAKNLDFKRNGCSFGEIQGQGQRLYRFRQGKANRAKSNAVSFPENPKKRKIAFSSFSCTPPYF